MRTQATESGLRGSMGPDESQRDSAVPSSFLSNFMKTNCSEHLDLNMTRALHFVEENSAYEERYVEEAYDSQLYLQILGTHPDYDGRGFRGCTVSMGNRVGKETRRAQCYLACYPSGDMNCIGLLDLRALPI